MIYSGGSIGKAENMIQKKENYDNVDVILKKIRIQNKLDFYLSSKSIYVKEDIQEILEYFSSPSVCACVARHS